MTTTRHFSFRKIGAALAAWAALSFSAALPAAAQQHGTLILSTTSAMRNANPYSDSSSQSYTMWCQVYGCLAKYNFKTKQVEGMLVDRWERVGDTTWRFHLRQGLKRSDGGPGPTSRDVVHSYQRALSDPQSSQAFYFDPIASITPIDDASFEVVTKGPFAPLLTSSFFLCFAITSEEVFKQHGAAADLSHPFGWGPYKLDSYTVDQQVQLSRNPNWAGHDARAPQTVVVRVMAEPAQRVTALLNGEISVAVLVPSQLQSRLENQDGVTILESPSQEIMFLALNPGFEPWTNPKIRRAAALAIDRKPIIDRLLRGLAQPVDGMIGPNQTCYDPNGPKLTYDPERAKALLVEAGFENGKGPKIVLSTSSGRYLADRQVSQVIAQMLTNVGFEVTLDTPEWANYWANVRKGTVATYYMGRGSVIDPYDPMTQYVQTGVTPRIKYSNAAFDALMIEQARTFDPETRCKVLQKAQQMIIDEAPLMTLWTHQLVFGVRSDIVFPVMPTGEVWLSDVRIN